MEVVNEFNIDEAIKLSDYYISQNNEEHLKYTIFCAENGIESKMLYLSKYYIKNKDIKNSIKYSLRAYETFDNLSSLTHICECLYYLFFTINQHLDSIDYMKELIYKFEKILIQRESDNVDSYAYLYLGNIFKILKKCKNMVVLYNIAIRKGNIEAMYIFGKFYLSLNIPDGVRILEEASNKNNFYSIQELGLYYFETGDLIKSFKYYNKLLAWENTNTNEELDEYELFNKKEIKFNPLVYLHLGFLFHINNEIKMSIQYYNKYIKSEIEENDYNLLISEIKDLYIFKSNTNKKNINEIRYYLINSSEFE